MSDRSLVGVYLLHNPNTDQTYVGSGSFLSRKTTHFRDLKNNCHINKKLQEAYNKDPNFDFIACELQDRQEAYDLEQEIINENINNPLLLNMSMKVLRPEFHGHTEVSKEKIRQSHIKNWENEEFRDKRTNILREAFAKKKNDPEWISNRSKISKEINKNMSEETKKIKSEKISIKAKEGFKNGNRKVTIRSFTEEELKLKSETMVKKWEDPVFKEQRIKAFSNRQYSDDAKDKISNNAKQRYENNKELFNRSIPVVINGIEYSSQTDASLKLKIPLHAINYRINNEKFSNWKKK